MLVSLVKAHGAHNWVRISSLIGSRTPKQCRERFHQNLKPTLNHDPITPEEGALIERLVAEMGKRWAEIARRLNGRSDNAVKNWWNGGMNRRRRLIGRQRNHGGHRNDSIGSAPGSGSSHHHHHHLHNHHLHHDPLGHHHHSHHDQHRRGSNDISPSPMSSPSPSGLLVFTARGNQAADPMISPTYSRYSGYSRGQTPSLISDSASMFSSSSPRLPASPMYENTNSSTSTSASNTLPPLLGLSPHGQERKLATTATTALFPSPEIYDDSAKYQHQHQQLHHQHQQHQQLQQHYQLPQDMHHRHPHSSLHEREEPMKLSHITTDFTPKLLYTDEPRRPQEQRDDKMRLNFLLS